MATRTSNIAELQRKHRKLQTELHAAKQSHLFALRQCDEESVKTVERWMERLVVDILHVELEIAGLCVTAGQGSAIAVNFDEPGGHDSPEATRHLDNPDGEPGYWKRFVGDSIAAANYDDDDSFAMINAEGAIVVVGCRKEVA
jgi:hypothetical protein